MAMRNTSTITEVPLGMFLHSQSLLLTAPQRQGQDLNISVPELAGPWGAAELGMRVPPILAAFPHVPAERTRASSAEHPQPTVRLDPDTPATS